MDNRNDFIGRLMRELGKCKQLDSELANEMYSEVRANGKLAYLRDHLVKVVAPRLDMRELFLVTHALMQAHTRNYVKVDDNPAFLRDTNYLSSHFYKIYVARAGYDPKILMQNPQAILQINEGPQEAVFALNKLIFDFYADVSADQHECHVKAARDIMFGMLDTSKTKTLDDVKRLSIDGTELNRLTSVAGNLAPMLEQVKSVAEKQVADIVFTDSATTTIRDRVPTEVLINYPNTNIRMFANSAAKPASNKFSSAEKGELDAYRSRLSNEFADDKTNIVKEKKLDFMNELIMQINANSALSKKEVVQKAIQVCRKNDAKFNFDIVLKGSISTRTSAMLAKMFGVDRDEIKEKLKEYEAEVVSRSEQRLNN